MTLTPAPANVAAPRDRLLTPGEVARMFRVDPKTVTRWATAGRLECVRTPGGHHRFWESSVRVLLEPIAPPAVVPEPRPGESHPLSA